MLNKVFNKNFLKELLSMSFLVSILHYFALINALYWVTDWYDVMMHFLGGATMAYLSLFIFFGSGYIKQTKKVANNKTIVFLLVIMFSMLIGLGWELWEVFVGFSDIKIDRFDTIKDLVMDFLGVIFVLYITKDKLTENV